MSEKKTDGKDAAEKAMSSAAGEGSKSTAGATSGGGSGAGTTPPERKGGGGFMALLALLLAGGGLVAGYQALQQNQATVGELAARSDRLEARLNTLDERATALEQGLAQGLAQAGAAAAPPPAAEGAAVADIEPRLAALQGGLEQQLEEKVGALEGRVSEQLAALESRLGERLAALQQELEQRVGALRDELGPQLAAVAEETRAALARETASLEKAIAALQTKVDELERDRAPLWEAAEVEYLINIAHDSLVLRRDVQTAVVAMRTAAQRLQGLEHPAFAATRQLVADELKALLAVPQVDVSATAFTLTRLQEQIAGLPLRDEKLTAGPPPAGGGGGSDAAQGEGGGEEPEWARFLDDMGESLKGLVIVRRRDVNDEPLLPPDRARFIGENLRLKLEAARLALLRSDEGVYHASLKTASQWLKRYYQEDAPGVQAMLKTLAELDQLVLQPQLPSVQASLKAIREVLESRAFLVSQVGRSGKSAGELTAYRNGAQAWLSANVAPVKGGEES